MIITPSPKEHKGRLGNQIIRNTAVSILARKHNLYVDYYNYDLINNKLGLLLFIGEDKTIFNNKQTFNYKNFDKFYNENKLECNLIPRCWFQEDPTITYVFNYFQESSVKNNVIRKNMFKNRYDNNNDIFIHVRLGDVTHLNSGIEYYVTCINKIKNYDNIYIASDNLNHTIIKELLKKYPNIKLIEYDEIKTIHFGSTNKYIILSHGTFSACIGYLSYYSEKIFYPDFNRLKKEWHPRAIFENKNWNCV